MKAPLIFLNKRDNTTCVNAQLLSEKLNITKEKTDHIVSRLKNYNLLNVHKMEGGGELLELRPTQAVPALLIIAREIIHRPNCYCYYSGGGAEPYF